MNERETSEYNERWMQNVLKHGDLMDHEKLLITAMIDGIPKDWEPKKPVDLPGTLFECDLQQRDNGTIVSTPFIWDSKKKKMSGKELEGFTKFWNAWDYKTSDNRAAAATAWRQIPDDKTEEFIGHTCSAATAEAQERGKRTTTPKMAQGWLNERRWEKHDVSSAQSPTQWSLEKWKETLDGPAGIFMHRSKSWPEYMPGPNPWEQRNTDIPREVHLIYAEKWIWK